MFWKQRIAIVEWAKAHECLFDNRTVVITMLYLIGLWAFDAVAWVVIVITASAYVLMIMRIAARPIGVLGTAIFFAAMLRWMDVPVFNELAETTRDSLIHLAQH